MLHQNKNKCSLLRIRIGSNFFSSKRFFHFQFVWFPSATHSSCTRSNFSDFIPCRYAYSSSRRTKIPLRCSGAVTRNIHKHTHTHGTERYIFLFIHFHSGIVFRDCCVKYRNKYTPAEMNFLNQIMFISYNSFQNDRRRESEIERKTRTSKYKYKSSILLNDRRFYLYEGEMDAISKPIHGTEDNPFLNTWRTHCVIRSR